MVVKVRGSNELQANRPGEIATSDELAIGGRNDLETFQAGVELVHPARSGKFSRGPVPMAGVLPHLKGKIDGCRSRFSGRNKAY